MKLVLHNYWRSSASQRVRIGLGLKGLAFEYVVINITAKGGAQQKSDGYRHKNPMAQVPTLEVTEDDGTTHTLVQSLPILEFIEERFPGASLFPRDPYDRAFVRSLAEVVNSGIQPFQNLTTTDKIKAFGGDDVMWVKDFVGAGLTAFANMLAEHGKTDAFCVGDYATVADCFLIPQIASARRFGVTLGDAHAHLLAIEQRCLALPAFANAAPDRQPDAVK